VTDGAHPGLPARLLFVFLDGVGLGGGDPLVNPLAAAPLPNLRDLAGGPLHRDPDGALPRRISPERACVPLDANLGVAGRPQSGTGQTSLLSGTNAAARFGRHFGPWVPTPLRADFARDNLLSRAAAAGRRACYANAVPRQGPAAGGRRRPAAPPFAARAAGVRIRGADDLAAGRAVASQITNTLWQRYSDRKIPGAAPGAAGRRLAELAGRAEVTLFAHFDTDHAGHRRDLAPAVSVLERVDAFLGHLHEALPADTLLLVTSDHGNVEDVRVGHTRNPVPLVAAGPGAGALAARVGSIRELIPALCETLHISPSPIPQPA